MACFVLRVRSYQLVHANRAEQIASAIKHEAKQFARARQPRIQLERLLECRSSIDVTSFDIRSSARSEMQQWVFGSPASA